MQYTVQSSLQSVQIIYVILNDSDQYNDFSIKISVATAINLKSFTNNKVVRKRF